MVDDKDRIQKLENNQQDIALTMVKINTVLDGLVKTVENLQYDIKEVTKENHNLNNAFIDFRSKVMTTGSLLVLGASIITFIINYFLKK